MSVEEHSLMAPATEYPVASREASRNPIREYLQFGLTLALTANICLWLGLYSATLIQNTMFGPADAFAGLWLGAILTVCGVPAGCMSYAISVGPAGALGWKRGVALAVLCAIMGALGFVVLWWMFGQLPFEQRPIFAYPRYFAVAQPLWLQATAVGSALLLISAFNIAFLFPVLGKVLRTPPGAAILISLLLIQPALTLRGPVQLAALRAASFPVPDAVVERDQDIDLLIRQKGLARIADLSNLTQYPHRSTLLFGPQTIARAQAFLHLPVTGLRDETLRGALTALPDKREWVLNANGRGDAKSMAELLAISWGPITANIRPGVYTPEPGIASAASPFDTLNLPDPIGGPLSSPPRGPLARALWEQAHMRREVSSSPEGSRAFTDRTITLKPDADGGVLFVEMQPIHAPSDFRLEHATIKFELARSVSPITADDAPAAFTLTPGARLEDIRILAPGPRAPLYLAAQKTDFAAPAAPTPPPGSSPHASDRPPLFAAVKIAADANASASAASPIKKSGDENTTDPVAILDQVEILSDGGDIRFGLYIEGAARILNSRIGAMRDDCLQIVGTVPVELVDNDFNDCAGAAGPPAQKYSNSSARSQSAATYSSALFPDMPPRNSSTRY